MRNATHPNTLLTSTLLATALVSSPLLAGTLEFYVQGEDLATEGFQAPKLTKDGWALTFEQLWVGLDQVSAYQTNPPYDPQQGAPMAVIAEVSLPEVQVVDLVGQAASDHRVLIAEVEATPGHYNAMTWTLAPVDLPPLNGASMLLIGPASRDGQTLPFQLQTTDRITHHCGEFVGDERKGIVVAGEIADVEMTFHLDHLFGRADRPADGSMNQQALGFDAFANDQLEHRFSVQALHLGHVGEGHCRVQYD